MQKMKVQIGSAIVQVGYSIIYYKIEKEIQQSKGSYKKQLHTGGWGRGGWLGGFGRGFDY